jgi:GrpB-like predicted nucleotidyltransferase (UPF0157 family)
MIENTLEIVAYDPAWPAQYDQERARLLAALGPAIAEIHHIGSTAVPGLCARPIIDILLTVDPEQSADYPALLAPLGYGLQPSPDSDQYLFHTPGPPACDIHLVPHGSPAHRRYLVFRNYLRLHPDSVQTFDALKRRLAAGAVPIPDGYVAGKQQWIDTTIAQSEVIVIVPYDPTWPAQFAAERAAVVAALGPFVRDIQHMGSTAVPGLAAKPIIDILVAVDSLDPAEEYIAALAPLGYQTAPGGATDRIFFLKGVPRTHHLHIVLAGSWAHRRHIAFRDYLRAHPETVQAYEDMKRALAAQFGSNREGYTNAKTAWIADVVTRHYAETGQTPIQT